MGGGMVPPGELLPPEDDCIVAVVRIGTLDVFAHEASRPDATAEGEGADDARACSRAGVLPWTNLTVLEAEAACEAAGFHLCSDQEWQDACGGAQRRWPFPYAPNHQPGTCNDHVSGTSELQPTGSQAGCVTPDGIFDMSGNVWEMTSDRSRRGASYRVNAVMFRTENARCDIPYDINEAFFGADLGYRCCRVAE
jgi:formylglycine-generating enzyme required for sulfatase activity